MRETRSQAEGTDHWDVVIQPKRSLVALDLRDVWRYRDLILLFVKRDLTAVYKQTVLGPLWYLIQPLISTAVLYVVFGKIARIPTDGVPPLLFYMGGTIVWSYFAGCLTRTADTFVTSAGLFGKVYFPRLAVPIAVVITGLVTFSIQTGLFMTFLGYHFVAGAMQPSPWMLALPVLVCQMAALGLGVGLLFSSLTTRYRDLSFLLTFGTQLWMYATPVVYPLSAVPERWRWAIELNPMSAVLESFRYSFLGSGTVDARVIATSGFITILLLGAGLATFSCVERASVDTV